MNRARASGFRVVDAEGDRLPEFYAIYRETAARAGFLIRTAAAYRDVWEAYRPTGQARLLFAEDRDGVPQAALFLVRCGPRVVEPYGGMTAAGAEIAGQLPAQVGGDPVLARAGRDELRPVGPGKPRDRAFQDRLRWSRDPLHRGLGPGARSVRQGDVRGRPGRPGLAGAATPRPRRPARPRRRGRGRRRRRVNGTEVHEARAAELDDWDARAVDPPGRARLPVAGLGRSPGQGRLAAAFPALRRRVSGPRPPATLAVDRRLERLHLARPGPHRGARTDRRPAGRGRAMARPARGGRGRRGSGGAGRLAVCLDHQRRRAIGRSRSSSPRATGCVCR